MQSTIHLSFLRCCHWTGQIQALVVCGVSVRCGGGSKPTRNLLSRFTSLLVMRSSSLAPVLATRYNNQTCFWLWYHTPKLVILCMFAGINTGLLAYALNGVNSRALCVYLHFRALPSNRMSLCKCWLASFLAALESERARQAACKQPSIIYHKYTLSITLSQHDRQDNSVPNEFFQMDITSCIATMHCTS